MTYFYAYADRSIAKLHYYLKQCGSSHFLFLYIYNGGTAMHNKIGRANKAKVGQLTYKLVLCL